MKTDALKRPEVDAFVNYAITNAVALVGETGYIPLTDELYRLARARAEKGVTGSVFAGGSQVGTRLQDLLEAEEAGESESAPAAPDTAAPAAQASGGPSVG